MTEKYYVAGYVKLAKLWEKRRDDAEKYHQAYYENKYKEDPLFELQKVYIDITGKKEIYKRPAMLQLINACMLGKVNCIASQTRAYLAANNGEFCYLIYILFSMKNRIDIVTEDDDKYQIDTIRNEDSQREALLKMASDFVNLAPSKYHIWKESVLNGINNLKQE